VVITTPNDTHAQFIIEAANAGKQIFCEKPLALDMADADAALEAVISNSVKLQIGLQRRFEPAYQEARKALLAGEVGNVELIVGTTRDPTPPPAAYLEHAGSFFVDTAIHDYDAVRFLTGLEVTDVFATAATLVLEDNSDRPVRDTAVTSLRLGNGALATITNSRRSTYGYDVRIEVAGSTGKISLGEERRSAVRTYSEAGVSHEFVGSYWELFEAAYVAELQHFVQCVAEDREPAVTGDDGRKALQIALLAERSSQEGRSLTLDQLS
jgi:myo-inositol 2-dehydrogenase/D-chiro-inositol 1-dehydrogenase